MSKETLLLKIIGDHKRLPDYFSDDDYKIMVDVLTESIKEKKSQVKKDREIFTRTLSLMALAIKDYSDWNKYKDTGDQYHGYFSYMDIVHLMFFARNATEEEIVAKCKELDIKPDKWLEITEG